MIVWEVTPRLSVKLSAMEPDLKSPLTSLPKKFAPIALIDGPKLEKTIESVAVFVDGQGSAVVPAPKKVVVSAAAV